MASTLEEMESEDGHVWWLFAVVSLDEFFHAMERKHSSNPRESARQSSKTGEGGNGARSDWLFLVAGDHIGEV